jgi:hypothetical protein
MKRRHRETPTSKHNPLKGQADATDSQEKMKYFVHFVFLVFRLLIHLP